VAEGTVSGVTGTRALRRVQRNGERRGRRQYKRESDQESVDTPPKNPRSRKGRYLDERC
jgi:hypothetical protein